MYQDFDKGRAHHGAGGLTVFSKLWRSGRAGQSTYRRIVVAAQLYKYSFGHCVDLAQIGLAKWLG
jgi:hypothetical protein